MVKKNCDINRVNDKELRNDAVKNSKGPILNVLHNIYTFIVIFIKTSFPYIAYNGIVFVC